MLFHKSYSSVFLGLVFLALILMPAYSTTITTYTTLASWQAATGAFQTVNFEGLAPAGSYTQYTTSLTQNGVTFIGYTGTGAVWEQVLDTSVSPYYNFGTGDALSIKMDRPTSTPLPYIHVTLPAAVTSFAADLFSSSSNGMTFNVTTNQTVGSNAYTVPTYNPPTLGFFGVTSDTPFTSVDLWLLGTTTNGGSQAFMDNFRFGSASVQQPADTPEAATFLLIGSGLIGLAFWRRRRARVEPQERRQGTTLKPCVSGSTI